MDKKWIERETDKENGVVLTDVPIGRRIVAVAMSGYIKPEDRNVEVLPNQTVSVEFKLITHLESEPTPTVAVTLPPDFAQSPPQKTKPPRPSNTKNKSNKLTSPKVKTADISPPKIMIAQNPPGNTVAENTVAFVLNSDEPATFSYYLEGHDSGYFESTSDNVKYKNLSDGSYIFYAKAKDLFGNETPKSESKSFVVDTTPPGATIIEGPKGTIAQNDVTFKFSSSEEAKFAFYLSGYEKGYSEYLQIDNRTYYRLPDGSYTFYVKSRDAVGNEDVQPAQQSFTVDTVAPGATITSGPDELIKYNTVTINFTARNPARFEYYLAKKEAVFSRDTKDTSIRYDNLPDGTYNFYVRARDDAGNVDKNPATLNFTIDTKAPKTTITKGPEGIIPYDDVTFVFAADEDATFSYHLKGYDSDYSDYTAESSKTYPNLPDGTYTFYVKARGAAGNIESDACSRTFTVKTILTLFKEDFEDEKRKIHAGDFNKSGGMDYWGRTQKRVKKGKFSLWCAGAGDPKSQYDKDMNAWYEIAIDLSYYTQAKLSFWYYLDTTNDVTDQFSVRVGPKDKTSKKDYAGFTTVWEAPMKKSIRKSDSSVTEGNTHEWRQQNIPLHTFAGKSIVIRICFDSDGLIHDEGAYIDDIVVIGKY